MKKKSKRSNVWESRTCSVCNKRFNSKITLEKHYTDNHYVNQTNAIDYHYMFNQERQKVEDLQKQINKFNIERRQAITEWIRSAATINDAIAHSIGEGIDVRS